MPCSAKFSVTLQTEILSTEISDFLKQIIFVKLFNSVVFFFFLFFFLFLFFYLFFQLLDGWLYWV